MIDYTSFTRLTKFENGSVREWYEDKYGNIVTVLDNGQAHVVFRGASFALKLPDEIRAGDLTTPKTSLRFICKLLNPYRKEDIEQLVQRGAFRVFSGMVRA